MKDEVVYSGLMDTIQKWSKLFDSTFKSSGSVIEKSEDRSDGSSLRRIRTVRGNVLILHILPEFDSSSSDDVVDSDDESAEKEIKDTSKLSHVDLRIKSDKSSDVVTFKHIENTGEAISDKLNEAEIKLYGDYPACFLLHTDGDDRSDIQLMLYASDGSWETVDAKFSVVNYLETNSVNNQKIDVVLDDSNNVDINWAQRVVDQLFPDSFEISHIERFKDNDSKFKMMWRTSASKLLKFGLSKISGSDELKLTSVFANYDSSQALADIHDIMNDSEFVSAVPDETSYYQVESFDSTLDVSPCDEFQPDYDHMFASILSCMMKAQYDALYSYVNMRSDSKFRLDCMDIQWMCQDSVCNLLEIWAELSGRTQHPLEFCSNNFYDSGEIVTTLEEHKSILRADLRVLADTMDFYYVNFEHDVRAILDDIIRKCKHLANYSI